MATIVIDHFDGLDTFDDLPRDGRCVRDYSFSGVFSRAVVASSRSDGRCSCEAEVELHPLACRMMFKALLFRLHGLATEFG